MDSWFKDSSGLEKKIENIVRESVEKGLGKKSGWGNVQGQGWFGTAGKKASPRVIRRIGK
jgi:hypothetical protein